MATENAPDADRDTDPETTRTAATWVVSTAVRLTADLLIVTGWVVFLTLLFLEAGWPRWAFYTLLIGGVGGYVALTAAWRRGGTSSQ